MVAQSTDLTPAMEAKLLAVCDVIRELEAVSCAPIPHGKGHKANAAVRLTMTRYYANRLRTAVGMPAALEAGQ